LENFTKNLIFEYNCEYKINSTIEVVYTTTGYEHANNTIIKDKQLKQEDYTDYLKK
jgi:hypothetical protein